MRPPNRPRNLLRGRRAFQKEHGAIGPGVRTIASLMLAPCSAWSMLFASLRPGPGAGPSGIDHASARHVTGSHAMVVSVPMLEGLFDSLFEGLDEDIARAYFSIITSVPHGTPSVRPQGQRSAHPVVALRARHHAQSSRIAACARRTRRFVGTSMSCEPRDLSRRSILRITRRDGDAFTSGSTMPWSERNAIDGRTIHDRHRSEHSSVGRCRLQAASALPGRRRVDRHIDAPERAIHQHESSRLACKGSAMKFVEESDDRPNRSRLRAVVNCLARRRTH